MDRSGLAWERVLDVTEPVLKYPCDSCGAEVGEACAPYCPLTQDAPDWAAEEYRGLELVEPTPEPTVEDYKASITKSLLLLPWSGHLPDPPDRREHADTEWLALTAAWLEDWRALLKFELEKLSADSKRAMVLQFEKDAVRGFLGLPMSFEEKQ